MSVIVENINYLNYLSDISKTGVTCLRGLSHGRCVYTRYRNNINDLIRHANNPKVNWFDTINDFTKAKYDHHYHASKVCVSGLRGIWIDIDLKAWIHQITRNPSINQEVKTSFFYYILFGLLKLAKLPKPTNIDDSGYGFHVFWLFNRRIPLYRNRKNLIAMWQKTVKAMLDRFNYICVHHSSDSLSSADQLPAIGDKNNSCNIAKLMRMPNTYNRKYGHKVLCRTVYQSHHTYSLVDLYKRFVQVEPFAKYLAYRRKAQRKYDERGHEWKNLERKHYIENGKRWAKENTRAKRRHQRFLRFKQRIKIVWGKNRYTLYIARCRDIVRLIKLRHNKMINPYNHKKCNEFAVFLYAVNYVHLSHDKHFTYNLTKYLSKVNGMLNKPLSAYDLNKIIKEAEQPDFMGYGYPLSRGQHNKLSKAYLKNSWYIKNLGITPTEMKSMKVLINSNEKRQRQEAKEPRKQQIRRIRRQEKSKRSGAKFKRNKRNKKIIKLHESGSSYRKIAKSLNIGLSTVRRVISRI